MKKEQQSSGIFKFLFRKLAEIFLCEDIMLTVRREGVEAFDVRLLT